MRFRLDCCVVLLLAVLAGCGEEPSSSAPASNPAEVAPVDYFPDLVFSQTLASHRSRSDWYAEHLAAMQEPSLFSAAEDEKSHVYRFLWLRTWRQPVAIRLEVDAQRQSVLHVKVLDGSGGYEPGELIRDTSTPVSYEDVVSFLETLEDIQYWGSMTRGDSAGTDGARWILEGVRRGRYHITDRWCADYTDIEIAKACLMLLKLAGMEGEQEP